MTFSASAIPRALRCIGSLVLPRQRYETASAEEGQDNHAEMEAAADIGNIDALPDAVRALIDEGDTLITETSFAYDVATDTGRRLASEPRAYKGLGPFELGATPDLAIYRPGKLVVVDYKNFEEVDDADENTQTATYALTLARAFGEDEVTVAIVYLGGLLRPSIATLSALDLDAHAERLKALHARVMQARAAFREGIVPDLATGKHCKYCEAFIANGNLCPKWAEFKKDSMSELPLKVEMALPLASDDDARWAVEVLERVDMFRTRLKAVIMARAAERPIPLADGRIYGKVQKLGKREIDADAAYALVRQKYGQEVADKSVQRKVAQKWIEDALKEAGVPGAKKAKDELVKQLEAAGAVKREEKTAIEVYEPAKVLKAI